MKRKAVVLITVLLIMLLLITVFLCIKTVTEAPQIQWEQTYTPLSGYSLAQTGDGGYIIAGCTPSKGTRASPDDALLIKTDPDGNEMWQKRFGGNEIQSGISALQTGDGGYIISGFSNRKGAGGFDFWMAKVTEN